MFAAKTKITRRLFALSPLLLAIGQAYAADEQAAAPQSAVTEASKPAAPVKAAPPVKATPPADGKLQQVEVKGNAASYDERRNDTATKIVVTQEEILKSGDTTISEVLKRLPGITLGGVQGRGGEIRMRGLGSGYTQILLNGEPSPPGFSLDSLSPDLIERIEIMRAATAEYSTQAVAGAINIVLKRAITTGQREIKIGAQDDFGKIGASVNLQISDRAGPFSYSVAGGLTHGDFVRKATEHDEYGYTPAGVLNMQRTTPQTNKGTFDGVNVSPRINFTVAPGETITSQSFFNFNEFKANTSDRTTVLLGTPPPFPGIDTYIDSSFTLARSDLTWTKKLKDGAKLDAKFGVNWNQRDNDVVQHLLDGKQNNLLTRAINSSGSDKGVSGNGKYSTPYAQDHALAIGWDGALSDRSESRIQRDSQLAAGISPTNLDETFKASVDRLAVFAQDEWNVTPRWSVYFGLRWEGLDTKSAGNTYAEVHNTSSVWSPLFQTLWKLPESKNDQLRFGLTRTYKAPPTNSLIPRRFTSINNSVTTPDTQGNPNLRPELAWGLDLAYEHYLAGGGLLSASTFVRRIQDITRREVALINGLWVSMPVNDGVATTRGIELEAKLPLRSIDKTLPAVEIRANLSRNWSTISTVPGPNNRIDQQTPFSGNLGLDYKMDKTPLTLGGNFSFQAGGPVRISANQIVYTTDKRVLDMYALWKFTPKVQLRMSVGNALHQDNVAENTYTDSFGAQRSTLLTPTSAVARANLEIKF